MKTIEFTEEELLFFFAMIQEKNFTDLYFQPPKGVPDPLLKALNMAQKSAYKASLSLSPEQINNLIELIYDQIFKLDDLLGKYDNIQTIRPKEGVPFWQPKTGNLQN